MEKKINLSNALFPWYSALSADLIFYIAINTVWLINIKGFSAAQMNFLSTVSSFTAIIFQIPMLSLIKKIGNVKSIRIGALFLLISSIMLTFCNRYIFFVIAKIFYQLSFIFEMMSAISLKNNLDYINKSDKYVDIRSRASMLYAIITAFTTLFCGLLFNLHKYLPMILGIVICAICFIITFFMIDVEECLPESVQLKDEKEEKKGKKSFPKPLKWFFVITIFYGLLFSLVVYSQQNGKLLVQNTFLEEISVEKTAVYLSFVMFCSRIARVVGNYFFPKVYKKMGDRIGIVLTVILLLSCLVMIFGSSINANVYVKAIIISLGFSLIPFLRDPLKLFCQTIVFDIFDKKYLEDIFAYMALLRQIGSFVCSLLASFILIRFSLKYLIIIFALAILPFIYLAILISYGMKKY